MASFLIAMSFAAATCDFYFPPLLFPLGVPPLLFLLWVFGTGLVGLASLAAFPHGPSLQPFLIRTVLSHSFLVLKHFHFSWGVEGN
jgi:hypothetical protein